MMARAQRYMQLYSRLAVFDRLEGMTSHVSTELGGRARDRWRVLPEQRKEMEHEMRELASVMGGAEKRELARLMADFTRN